MHSIKLHLQTGLQITALWESWLELLTLDFAKPAAAAEGSSALSSSAPSPVLSDLAVLAGWELCWQLTDAEAILFPTISVDTVSFFLLLHILSQQPRASKRPGASLVCWFFRLPCSVLLWYWDLSWLKGSPCHSQSTALPSQKDLLSWRETRAQAHLLATFTYIEKWAEIQTDFSAPVSFQQQRVLHRLTDLAAWWEA